MLCRTVPKNSVNLVLYRVIVVCRRIFIDGFLGVVQTAWPTSGLRDRRHASRSPADEDDSHRGKASREPGSDDESYASSNGCDGKGGSRFNDNVPFSEGKAEMVRTTPRTDAEAGG